VRTSKRNADEIIHNAFWPAVCKSMLGPRHRSMIAIRARELFALLSIVFLAALSIPAVGQQQENEEELAKKTQNPVADLISVPLQSNFNFGAGLHRDKMIYILNIQPVIPINITENWNLITRVIMPVINQPSLAPGLGTATGLGDINPTFFLSPAKPGELIWGYRANVYVADRERPAAGQRSMEHGSGGSRADDPGPLGVGRIDE
jgi:hypothetical protein